VAVAVAELVHLAGLDGVDELVDERVAGEVEDSGAGVAIEEVLTDGLQQVGLSEADAAVDEQGVVRLAGLLGDGDAGGVGEAVIGAGDEVVEDVVGVEREGLVPFVEDAAVREVVAVKGDGDEAAGDRLGRNGEGLLALALAEIELRGVGDRDLNHAVGELARDHLVEPDAVESRVLGSDDLQHLSPDGRVKGGRLRSAARGQFARRRRLGR
jgi:hypothetical protein